MQVKTFDAVVTDVAQCTFIVIVLSAYSTVILRIFLTVIAEATDVTNHILWECLTAFRAMVLFVAIARLRVIGAVGSAVAEPVVKSVAAAILTFGAVLVARKGGDLRRGQESYQHHHCKQYAKHSC